jgi:hypothetical protein
MLYWKGHRNQEPVAMSSLPYKEDIYVSLATRREDKQCLKNCMAYTCTKKLFIIHLKFKFRRQVNQGLKSERPRSLD